MRVGIASGASVVDSKPGGLLVAAPSRWHNGDGKASTKLFIEWIADHAGFTTPADIKADGVNCFAGKLRDECRAVRTIQAKLNAIKKFTKWLTDHHKLPPDPLSLVKKPNPKADRRRDL